MSKEVKPTPESGARFPKMFSLARNRALKRVAFWVGGVSLGCFGIIALFAGLLGGHHGFTTQIDRGAKIQEIVLKNTRNHGGAVDDDGVYFLRAEGLNNAKPVETAEVLKFCQDELYGDENLSGSHVLEDVAGGQRAYAYTFYLSNTSQEKDLEYTFLLNLDSYSSPSNSGSKNPYAYLRVMVFANSDMTQHEHTIYGALSDQSTGTVDGGAEDRRECISDFVVDHDLRKPTVKDGEVGYCTPFGNGMELIREDRRILKGETVRYTIVTYFEALDPECSGPHPQGASLSMSAHFGD